MFEQFLRLFNNDLLMQMISYMSSMDYVHFGTILSQNREQIIRKMKISQKDTIFRITEDDLKTISSLTNIEYLDLGVKPRLEYLSDKSKNDIGNNNILDLINLTHLTHLNLSSRNKITEDAITALIKFTNLTRLALKNLEHLTDFHINLFSRTLTNLKNLNISDTKIHDQGLKLLSNLINLEDINISNSTYLTDEGIKFLKNMTNLKTLRMGNSTDFTNSVLNILTGLTNLTYLNIFNLQSFRNFESLSVLTNLVELDISSTSVNNINFLYKLTKLKYLNLSNRSNMDEILNLNVLANLTNLEKLKMSECKFINIPNIFYYMSDLKELYLNTVEIDIKQILNLTNLEKLKITSSILHNIDDLTYLTNINQLYLHGNSIKNVDFLKSLTNLTKLSMYFEEISDTSPIIYLKKLENIIIDDVFDNINLLSQLPKLREIVIENIHADNDLNQLSQLTNLKIIKFYYADSMTDYDQLNILLNIPSLEEIHLITEENPMLYPNTLINNKILEIKRYTYPRIKHYIFYLNPNRFF